MAFAHRLQGPREIEEVLYAYPAVLEAAVVGKPDERLGEEVLAVVVLRPGSRLSADELIAYAREPHPMAGLTRPQWWPLSTSRVLHGRPEPCAR